MCPLKPGHRADDNAATPSEILILINDTNLANTTAGQSLANIISSGLVMGLTGVVGGGDAAAYAGAEFKYNYLHHAEQLRREKAKLLLQKCDAAAGVASAPAATCGSPFQRSGIGMSIRKLARVVVAIPFPPM